MPMRLVKTSRALIFPESRNTYNNPYITLGGSYRAYLDKFITVLVFKKDSAVMWLRVCLRNKF